MAYWVEDHTKTVIGLNGRPNRIVSLGCDTPADIPSIKTDSIAYGSTVLVSTPVELHKWTSNGWVKL